MAYTFKVDLTDKVSPDLRELIGGLEDATGLHTAIAALAEGGVRDYIRHVAAPTRHKTARKLGAKPTGYLERAADGVSAHGTKDACEVIISGDVGIFARVSGPVTIKPGPGKKYLTIPAIADAYGRRAGEFPNLKVLVWRKAGGGKTLALGTEEGTGKNRTRTVFFWLVKKVTQPQDRALLPSDQDLAQIADEGMDLYLEHFLN